ncbi:lysylphosphatidylglycerol synthase domain-containing protein [Kamptonema formosum]|uniref:lysylphosphatidylglycerol synthase domain-containing protein n=1 Tax=Kamptonema formosum TaxID=331992 RepID=UPI00034B0DBA|nr:lysylphosphatidylglycerol synthase domain-containing protein [Oscillatoria sp. PCC 10802]
MWRLDFRKFLQQVLRAGSRLKPFLRWAILGGTLFFLGKTLKDCAAEVAAVRMEAAGWLTLALAFLLTLLAHLWAARVWAGIVRSFSPPVPVPLAVRVYLKTNIAKYLPGNVWHFYGRILAVTAAGVSPGMAALSVLLEPVLMAADALLIALTGNLIAANGHSHGLASAAAVPTGSLALLLLAVVAGIHPRILNPVMQFLVRLKGKAIAAATARQPAFKQREQSEIEIAADVGESYGGECTSSGSDKSFRIERYPFWPAMGELGFLGLRGAGFVLALQAVAPVSPAKLPVVLGAFSWAWLLGLVVPGAPGGIGVFEATVTVLLDGHFGAGTILIAAAFYRLVSVLAEAAGALLACWDLRHRTTGG